MCWEVGGLHVVSRLTPASPRRRAPGAVILDGLKRKRCLCQIIFLQLIIPSIKSRSLLLFKSVRNTDGEDHYCKF